MTVVRQNILSNVNPENDKLSNGNVRLHLAIPEICQARNLSSQPRWSTSNDLCAHQIFSDCLQNFRYYYLYQKESKDIKKYCQNGQSIVEPLFVIQL